MKDDAMTMREDAVKKLLDDYALGELRREAEAARLAAKAAVAARVEEFAKAGDVEALAKLAPVVAAVMTGGTA